MSCTRSLNLIGSQNFKNRFSRIFKRLRFIQKYLKPCKRCYLYTENDSNRFNNYKIKHHIYTSKSSFLFSLEFMKNEKYWKLVRAVPGFAHNCNIYFPENLQHERSQCSILAPSIPMHFTKAMRENERFQPLGRTEYSRKFMQDDQCQNFKIK